MASVGVKLQPGSMGPGPGGSGVWTAPVNYTEGPCRGKGPAFVTLCQSVIAHGAAPDMEVTAPFQKKAICWPLGAI